MAAAFVGSPVFNAIVGGARWLQRYQAGNFVIRTFQGAGNIISGSAQYVAGHAFKYTKNPKLLAQSAPHIERGARVFKEGVSQFAPGAVAAALVYMGARTLVKD